ncbi:sulfotransferase [Candidatus Gracilibacteria bacterium]|nr:sulfotransferase [Candidatus Gracilibacteria bacterium]NJM87109.1 sulfotransferase [Hydrococcus sp. RU_2_2]NJP20438.1 sulfotransferase [Hydrococcus sp. CRU_1_1]
MKLPNFLIVGVQKAGTTSIYNYLNEHPQVYMSPIKETNFLAKDWETIDPELDKKQKTRTFEQYCLLFQNVKDEIAIGEASPNYLFHYQTSANRIQRYVPNAKLIAILRDPAERAYSDYLMHVRDCVGYRSLSEQIKYSAHKSFMLRKGFYYEPLKHYINTFGKQQIKIYLYKDLCQSPFDFMKSIYQFIGVKDSFQANVSKKVQVAQIPKNKIVNELLSKPNFIRSSIAKIAKYILPSKSRKNLRQSLIKFNSQDKKQAPLSAEDRQKLIEFYREDILRLQDLIQRDLSFWLQI